MAKFLLMSLNSPSEGQEDEYNKWYEETHIPEILSVPGVKSAKRYKSIGGSLTEKVKAPYVAIYEIEADDIQTVFGALGAKLGAFPACFEATTSSSLFATEISSSEP